MKTATSPAFVETPDFLLLAQAAETWSCRPSDLLGGTVAGTPMDATLALQIDVAAAIALWRWKQQNLGRLARGPE